MKKFLAVIAIASFAIACNNKSEKTTTEDSTIVSPVDTTTPVIIDTNTPPVIDTLKMPDSTSK